MPITGLPNQTESTLHTLVDGSEWYAFPAAADTGFTPTTTWRITDDQLIEDNDRISIEAVNSTFQGRPRRNNVGSIPIYMHGTSAQLMFNGCYKGTWNAETYQERDAVFHNGTYWINTGVATAAEVPGVSNLWVAQTINRPSQWTCEEDALDVATSGPNGLAVQFFISNGASLDIFNARMECIGGIIGDDVEFLSGATPETPVAYTIRMHEAELYNSSDRAASFFRVRTNALTSDSNIQSLRLNGLTQGMYLYDPTSNSWGTALDNLELTVLRGGIIMDAGSTPVLATLRDFDETVNLARADTTNENADAVYSIGVASVVGGDIGDIATTVCVNNARGMECGAYPRIGVPTNQRRGSVITVKETSFFVRDDEGNGINGVTVYIPSEHSTSITAPNGDVVTFNENMSQTLLSGTDYVPDPTNSDVTLTTGSDGNTPQESVHLGYWQFSNEAADNGGGNQSARLAAIRSVGNLMFEQVGNSATVIYSVFGREITTQTVDFTGTGVLNVTSPALPVAAGVTGTAAPTHISFSRNSLTNAATVTLTADATLDDLFDAIHAEEISMAESGTIVNYADVDGSSIDFVIHQIL